MIARYDRQVVDQRRCGDLFIQCIFLMWRPEPSPELSNILVDIENAILVFGQQRIQPLLQLACLARVTPVTNQFDATAQLTYRDNRDKEPRLLLGGLLEEITYTPIRLRALPRLTNDIGINQIQPIAATHKSDPEVMVSG